MQAFEIFTEEQVLPLWPVVWWLCVCRLVVFAGSWDVPVELVMHHIIGAVMLMALRKHPAQA